MDKYTYQYKVIDKKEYSSWLGVSRMLILLQTKGSEVDPKCSGKIIEKEVSVHNYYTAELDKIYNVRFYEGKILDISPVKTEKC